MRQMNVKMAGTTNDSVDSLEYRVTFAKEGSFNIKELPNWRPDKAFNIELVTFSDYITKLGEVVRHSSL